MRDWNSWMGHKVVRSELFQKGKPVGAATSKEAEEAIIRLLNLCATNFSTSWYDEQGHWVGGESWSVSPVW